MIEHKIKIKKVRPSVCEEGCGDDRPPSLKLFMRGASYNNLATHWVSH